MANGNQIWQKVHQFKLETWSLFVGEIDQQIFHAWATFYLAKKGLVKSTAGERKREAEFLDNNQENEVLLFRISVDQNFQPKLNSNLKSYGIVIIEEESCDKI